MVGGVRLWGYALCRVGWEERGPLSYISLTAIGGRFAAGTSFSSGYVAVWGT